MTKYITYLFIVVVVFSCKNNAIERPQKPEDLIPKSKMVDVLYDMSLISAAKGVNRTILENKGVQPEAFIFNKHDIDSAQFASSNAYYAYDLDVYQQIYQEVKDRLEKDKENNNALVVEEKKRQDSLAKNIRSRDSLRRRNRKDSIIKGIPLEKVKKDPLKKVNKFP